MTIETETTVRISELFNSIQGEGVLSGVPMVFIRFQGCSLGCTWCDTKYTWSVESPQSRVYTISSLLLAMGLRRSTNPIKWVCITGGEPLEQLQAFKEVVIRLKLLGYEIEVETSGLVPLPGGKVFGLVDSWVVDLKCPSSQAIKKPVFSDLERLCPRDQLKAVVKSQEDLQFVQKTLGLFPTKAQVLISPVFSDRGELDPEWAGIVAKFCVEEGYRLSLQIHKFIWGMKRGV